uniref:Uncharacterized protein n=1 Tax=Anguilla anguilla TaxID=7936 RepID=A0A0E9UW47_ANGAN
MTHFTRTVGVKKLRHRAPRCSENPVQRGETLDLLLSFSKPLYLQYMPSALIQPREFIY